MILMADYQLTALPIHSPSAKTLLPKVPDFSKIVFNNLGRSESTKFRMPSAGPGICISLWMKRRADFRGVVM